ncbi:MAG TPA: alpha/beta fold hydrolase [Alphaproteobacteria bacterium]
MPAATPRFNRRAILIRLIAYPVLFYAAAVASMYAYQRSLLYFPDAKTYSQTYYSVVGFEDVTVTTEDGHELTSWYAPAKPDKKTILVFHGNAGSFHSRAHDFMPLVNAGYGVMLAEYRGYGGNKGTPTETGLYQDADAYVHYLLDEKGVSPYTLVLYGESLGTGIATEMAVRYPDISALVLESPFTSMVDITALHYPYIPAPNLLVRDRYDTISKASQIKMPTLVLYGDHDVVVPGDMSQQVFDAITARKDVKIIPNAGHIEVRAHGGLKALQDFLETLQ